MFDKLQKTIKKGGWYALAMIIVMVAAGPEIMLSMELMAMVELLGASTFVLAYWSGVKLFLAKPIACFKRFESRSMFFIPTKSVLKQMPSMIIHAIPERTSIAITVTFYTLTIIAVLVCNTLSI